MKYQLDDILTNFNIKCVTHDNTKEAHKYDDLFVTYASEVADQDSINKYLNDICKQIFDNNYDINVLYSDIIISNETSYNMKNIVNILNQNIIEYCNKLSLNIQTLINNNMTVNDFLTKYNEYNNNMYILKKIFWNLDKKTKYESNSRTYHLIDLLKNFHFFDLVINTKYKYLNESELYCLYEIFTNFLITELTEVTAIIKIFNFCKFFNSFEKLLFVNKIILQNTPSNNSLVIDNNEGIIKKIILYVDTELKTIYNNSKNTNLYVDNKKKLDEIKYIIDIGNKLNDKTLWVLTYDAILTNRLLSSDCVNCDIEKKILSWIDSKDNIIFDILCKMSYKIDDISTSLTCVQQLKEKLKILSKPEKYANIPFDLKFANYKLLRNYIWNLNNNVSNYEPPLEVQIYVKTILASYEKLYPYRKLTVNHDMGSGVLKLCFGDKTYHIHMSLSQMYVMILLNNHKNLTINEINTHLQTTKIKDKMDKVINSLLLCKLIKSDEETDTKFSINSAFSFQVSKLSVQSLLKSNIKILNKSVVNENDQLISTIIYNIVKTTTNSLNATEIEKKYVEKKYDIKFDSVKLNNILTQLVETNKLSSRMLYNVEYYSFDLDNNINDEDHDSDDSDDSDCPLSDDSDSEDKF